MLSYQHSYHAGCFADVMKHALLGRVLDYLIRKDNPMVYLDTHSGRGRYDLQDAHALKTKEADLGIFPLWEKREQLSDLFLPYIKSIEQLNNVNNEIYNPDESSRPNRNIQNTLRYYPGSPEIAIQLLREQDRLVFCELHPNEFECISILRLQAPRRMQKRIFCKKEDGLKTLNALLPPIERRGLVFMDPSYERKSEYQEMIQALNMAYKRCPTMTYCLWYPYINHKLPENFLKNLQDLSKKLEIKNTLRLELHLNQNNQTARMGVRAEKTGTEIGMTGSGLFLINPPYTLANEGKKMLEELTKIIQPNSSSYCIKNI